MGFYNNIFYLLYISLKKIEGGFSYQTDWNRAIEAVFIISTFEMLNILSIWPWLKNTDGELWVPYIMLLLLNAIVFLVSARYKKIVNQFLSKPPSLLNNIVVVLYLIGTIVFFIFTRP